MTALGVARLATGVAAAALLGAMIWIGQTQIAPVVPEGKLLQGQVFGYDTNTLARFALQIAGSDIEAAYRATLVYLDTVFIAAFCGFTVAMLWPRHALAGGLALLYAVSDLLENQLILAEVDRMSGIMVLYPPPPGTLSLAGYLTAQKYGAIALILGAIVYTWAKAKRS